MTRKRIVVTGAEGFIGKNLCLRLRERAEFEVVPITRGADDAQWLAALKGADHVVHLAGVNRPLTEDAFMVGNHGATLRMVETIEETGRAIPIIYASSIKAVEPTPYGLSKKAAEDVLQAFSERVAAPVVIFRLPNVFGKWCQPNYNSAIATFCHNIARDLPIVVNDPDAPLRLVYVDDVIDAFIDVLQSPAKTGYSDVGPVYDTSVGEVAARITGFRDGRRNNCVDAVGCGLIRALYATYVASLPLDQVSYPIQAFADSRGTFSEILKTRDSGQFSFFTALPGVTRGGHYHHTKTEKFLIVQGEALFRFRHVVSGESFELRASADQPRVVETVPGWAHDITNTGNTLMISLLWANEAFDRARPDTITAEL